MSDQKNSGTASTLERDTDDATEAQDATTGWRDRLRGAPQFLRSGGIAIGLLLVLAVLTALEPSFLSFGNLTNVALQSAINAVVAIGMTFVIIGAGIDLSVGSMLALVAVIMADLMAMGLPFPLAVLAALVIGGLLGAINGVLIVRAGLAPFIVTLGTLSAYRGFALIYTGGRPIFDIPDSYKAAFSDSVLGVPAPVWIAALVAIGAHITLRHTRLGEYVLALGGNPEAARLSGVNISRTTAMTYVISGIMSAIAAIILVARLGAAEPIAGEGYELTAIAAAAMGGASLAGGRGSIVGTVIGALLIAALQAGLTVLNVQAFYQLVAIGVVIILAVLADRGNE